MKYRANALVHKRKIDPVSEAEVTDLLSEVSLSPQKKHRGFQSYEGPSGLAWNNAVPDGLAMMATPSSPQEEIMKQEALSEWCQAQGLTAQPSEESMEDTFFTGRETEAESQTTEDEDADGAGGRALVLYRGLVPPAASSGLLAPADASSGLTALEALASGKASLSVGPDFMKALDLSGMLEQTAAAGLPRRLQRANSCSSIPSWSQGGSKDRAADDDQMEDMQSDETQDNAGSEQTANLAVIPWTPLPVVPPQPVPAQSAASPIAPILPSPYQQQPTNSLTAGPVPPYLAAFAPTPINSMSAGLADPQTYALPINFAKQWPVAPQS